MLPQAHCHRTLRLHILHYHRALPANRRSQGIGQHRIKALVHAVTGYAQPQLRHLGFSRLLKGPSCFRAHRQPAVKVVRLQAPFEEDNAIFFVIDLDVQ